MYSHSYFEKNLLLNKKIYLIIIILYVTIKNLGFDIIFMVFYNDFLIIIKPKVFWVFLKIFMLKWSNYKDFSKINYWFENVNKKWIKFIFCYTFRDQIECFFSRKFYFFYSFDLTCYFFRVRNLFFSIKYIIALINVDVRINQCQRQKVTKIIFFEFIYVCICVCIFFEYMYRYVYVCVHIYIYMYIYVYLISTHIFSQYFKT